MLRKLILSTFLSLLPLPLLAAGVNYVFNIDNTLSTMALTLNTSTGSSSPSSTALFGDFTLNLGNGTGPGPLLVWNVPAKLQTIFAENLSPVSLTIPGVNLTVNSLQLLDFDQFNNNPGTTLAGGPPTSTGIINTDVQFFVNANGTVSTPLGPAPIGANRTEWSPAINWNIDLTETSPGLLSAHITANGSLDLIAGNPSFGSIGVALDFVGTATHNVSPSPVPLPGAVWLFGSGLLGLLGFLRQPNLQHRRLG